MSDPIRAHGRLRFDGWSISDPCDDQLHEAMHRARYDLGRLTQQDANRILAAAEAYVHLATHPARTEQVIEQLRAVRRAAREEASDE